MTDSGAGTFFSDLALTLSAASISVFGQKKHQKEALDSRTHPAEPKEFTGASATYIDRRSLSCDPFPRCRSKVRSVRTTYPPRDATLPGKPLHGHTKGIKVSRTIRKFFLPRSTRETVQSFRNITVIEGNETFRREHPRFRISAELRRKIRRVSCLHQFPQPLELRFIFA
jgi:hypothetical protein